MAVPNIFTPGTIIQSAQVNDNFAATTTGVTAGTGLTGGGASGAVTLSVDETWLATQVGSGGTGADGAQGPQGPQGPAGSTGPAGPAGPQGIGINLLGSIPTAGPPSDPGVNQGDAYIDSNGDMWVWDGTAWNDVGQIQGPPGAAGAQGPQGPQGLIGPTGPAGPTGANGTNGTDGATGPAGPTGAVGPQGPTGPADTTGDTSGVAPGPGQIGEYYTSGQPVTFAATTTQTQTVTIPEPLPAGIWFLSASFAGPGWTGGVIFYLAPQPAGLSTSLGGAQSVQNDLISASNIIGQPGLAVTSAPTNLSFTLTTNMNGNAGASLTTGGITVEGVRIA